MNKEEMLQQEMIICTECGWEIARGGEWISPICDDCSLDKAIQHDKEQGITV